MQKDNEHGLTKKVLIICWCFFCLGVNNIVFGYWYYSCVHPTPKIKKASLFLGIIYLLLIPITIRDTRKEMRSLKYVVISGTLYILQGIYFCFIGLKWVYTFLAEIIIAVLVVEVMYKRISK